MTLSQRRLRNGVLLSLLVVFPTLYYWPAIFLGQTQAFGDSIYHGLALLNLHSESLNQWTIPLWSQDIYGGHPVFAEGHIGFFNPLMLATSLLFDPVYGQNFFHFFCMVVSGCGMFLLCRELGRSRPAATLASLALVFSSVWLMVQNNITVSGSLAWGPWVLWAMERWLKEPDTARAGLLSLLLSFVILGGYPQVFHALIIAIVLACSFTILDTLRVRSSRHNLKSILITGIVIAVLTSSLAAVQLLPLFELISQSHRSDGVGLHPVAPGAFLNGFLFSKPWDVKHNYFPVIGSTLFCLLACLSIVVRPGPRERGYILAATVLIMVGVGNDFPLHQFLVKYSLLPGLDYFRMTYVYLNIAIICLAVLAAFTVDQLPRREFSRPLVTAMVLVFLAVTLQAYFPGANTWHGYFALLALLITVGLFITAREAYAPTVILLLIVAEIVFTRIGFVQFVEKDALREPPPVARITLDDPSGMYRVYEDTKGQSLSMLPPDHEIFDDGGAVQKMLASLTSSSNLLWGIPSIQGAHALELRRRAMIEPQLRREIKGYSELEPGLRLIDYLGVQYITTRAPTNDFEMLLPINKRISLMRNNAAHPKFQTFHCFRRVDTPEDALALLTGLNERALVIEQHDEFVIPSGSASTDGCNVTERTRIDLQLVSMSDADYQLISNGDEPVWLFVADSNYPGWSARVDDEAVPVFSAQILGKAIWLPEGKHRITFEYRSRYIVIGAISSFLSLLFVIVLITRKFRKAQ